MSTNGKYAIREVLQDDIPARHVMGFFVGLAEELLLRLEATRPPMALHVTLATTREARNAACSLRKAFIARKGRDAVRITQRAEALFVLRGPGWK